jgi:hypothetical protein
VHPCIKRYLVKVARNAARTGQTCKDFVYMFFFFNKNNNKKYFMIRNAILILLRIYCAFQNAPQTAVAAHV